MKDWPHVMRLFGLAGMVALAACETVVSVDTPAYEPRLVPQAFFTSDSLWVVQVNQTVAFTSIERPPPVDHATVQIWRGDELFTQLVRSDSGIYRAQNTSRPRPGERYTLHVEAPGFLPTSGGDALPGPPAITGLEAVSIPPETPQTRLLRRVEVALDLQDEAGIENYYGIFLVQARLFEERSTGTLTPYPPSVFIFESTNPVFDDSEFDFIDTDAPQFVEAFFTDDLFDGRAYSIDLAFRYDVSDPAQDVQIHRAFAVVVLSVSEDFFRFWKTASEQGFSNENPFAEPLRVHSNMSGGLGVFAGFQFQAYPVAVDTLAYSNVCEYISSHRRLCDSLLQTSPLSILRFR